IIIKTNCGGCLARDHFGAVKGAYAPRKHGAGKNVVGLIVSVGPYTELRIVVKRGTKGKRVTDKRSGRIARGRNRKALQEWHRLNGELRNDPPIGDLIIGDRRIAIVVGLAPTAKTGPQRVDRDGSKNYGSSTFVEHCVVGVHDLHEMIWANV